MQSIGKEDTNDFLALLNMLVCLDAFSPKPLIYLSHRESYISGKKHIVHKLECHIVHNFAFRITISGNRLSMFNWNHNVTFGSIKEMIPSTGLTEVDVTNFTVKRADGCLTQFTSNDILESVIGVHDLGSFCKSGGFRSEEEYLTTWTRFFFILVYETKNFTFFFKIIYQLLYIYICKVNVFTYIGT